MTVTWQMQELLCIDGIYKDWKKRMRGDVCILCTSVSKKVGKEERQKEREKLKQAQTEAEKWIKGIPEDIMPSGMGSMGT